VGAFLLAGNENYSALATALVTIAVIIFGETIPKITAKKGANRIAMQDAYPLRGLMILFWLPVRAVVGLVNLILKPFPGEKAEEEPEEKVEELTTLIDTAEDESVIDENESEFSVYPNPVNSTLFVNSGNAEFSYEMYNGMGQKVANGQANGNAQISVSGLNKGVYFLRLTSGTQVRIEKVVVE
jgi:hypothetical protein